MPPAISLAIVAYNRAGFVGNAIRSVLNQTLTDFELVIWDDGSTDDTLTAARAAVRGDPRVKVVAGPHQGIVLSLNAAVAQLSGNYLGWIDSDDMLGETALAETAAVLNARPEVGVVYTDYVAIDEAGVVKGAGMRTKVPYSKDRILIDFMTFQFRLMRRELFDKAGKMNPAAECAEDYDLCLRLSEIAEFYHLPRSLYYYRQHSGMISKQRKLEQIDASANAIRAAMKRRGMEGQYELEVEYNARFRLRKKN